MGRNSPKLDVVVLILLNVPVDAKTDLQTQRANTRLKR